MQPESCFHTDEISIKKDGQMVKMKRQRLRLKKNALPTISPPSEQQESFKKN
jgi:hypothetical protein